MKKLELNFFVAITLMELLLYSQAIAALNTQRSLSCAGSITALNLNVFLDPACTFPITNINWGNVTPGSTNPTTIYIKNTGNVPETLNLTYGNWTPTEAPDYLTLNWNITGTLTLPPSSAIAVALSLAVASRTIAFQNFTFTITITGTQT
jgi:hypothetical protein